MASMSAGGPQGDDLDLERAEFEDESDKELRCGSCGVPIAGFYFTAGGSLVCERCRLQLEERRSQGSSLGRLSRAGLFGGVAAVIGAGLWALVTHLTGYEIGLVAIVVGWAVGSAVHVGSGARGGPAYQLLAVFLTYMAIVSTYAPYVIEGLSKASEGELSAEAGEPMEATDAAAPFESMAQPEELRSLADPMGADSGVLVADELEAEEDYAQALEVSDLTAGEQAVAVVAFVVIVLAIAAAAPFLAGAENIIGILIIGIALWEAWRRNRRVEFSFEGPFEVGKPPPAAV